MHIAGNTSPYPNHFLEGLVLWTAHTKARENNGVFAPIYIDLMSSGSDVKFLADEKAHNGYAVVRRTDPVMGRLEDVRSPHRPRQNLHISVGVSDTADYTPSNVFKVVCQFAAILEAAATKPPNVSLKVGVGLVVQQDLDTYRQPVGKEFMSKHHLLIPEWYVVKTLEQRLQNL